MIKSLLILALSLLALASPAQPSGPVRVAVVPETTDVSAACDVLTARLSSDAKLQLLERADIERLYREQGLSAANREDLKLGRLLGADGLLLLNLVRTPQSTNLLARVVAVKPGVILTEGTFPWPLPDLSQWTEAVASRLDAFVPKLRLTAKDAVAISVVNLRSAVQSAEATELEHQLKLLAIQRLSRERQFFVLERQKMQLLSEEKQLKADEAAFWDGSYLLDGIVDQSGYSKDTVTINGRLTPPKGGTPLTFEVSGSRQDLTEVINRLAVKVVGLLNAQSSVPEWNAAAEATQFFEEANWALRWGVVPEAQAAADSAWALGKRDLECATIRIKAYEGALEVIPIGEKGWIDASVIEFEQKSGRNGVAGMLARISNSWPAVTFERNQSGISYVTLQAAPNPQMVDGALHVLALYDEFSRHAPEDRLKAASEQSGWRTSGWYGLGIEALTSASRTLEYYYLCPKAQPPVAEKLAELRALARSVADWIAQAPTVHDSYFVGDRLATHDELAHTIGEDGGNSNIFRCALRWGGLWQESPEDCIALYRKLMASPVFCYIHSIFWSHRIQDSLDITSADHSFEPPRLVAWRAQDRERIPSVWNSLVRELNASTNVLLQLEAKAVAVTDAKTDQETGLAFTNFFAALFANQDALLNNNVEQFYLDWGAGDLVSTVTSGGVVTPTKESLQHVFYSEYYPRLEALGREYWTKTVPAKKFLEPFEKQKQYLKENKPYEFFEFARTFQERNYTTNQALEIRPLVAAYKSNLVARSQGASGIQKGQMMGAISQVGFLENNIDRILSPPAPPTPAQPKVQPPPAAAATKAVIAPRATVEAPAAVTNVINVSRFLPLPLDGLPGDNIAGVSITAHHWLEGKLVLDFQYGAFVYSFNTNGNWKSTSNVTFPGVAILDPATEHWRVISCPATDGARHSWFYHHTTLWCGEVFTSNGGQIKRFNRAQNAWQVLQISDVGDCELFTVNDHLYAATPNLILELLEGGTSTRILASNRRRPPVSALDTQNLGTPALFAGPGQSLRAFAGTNIVTWSNDNWQPVCSAPNAPSPPVSSDNGVIFLANGWNAPPGIWHLARESNRVEFWLGQDAQRGRGAPTPQVDMESKPTWKLPPGFSLPRLSAACRGPDLYLLADHAKSQNIVNEQEHLIIGQRVLAQDGYHAELLCFASNYPAPQELFLKFDREGAVPPVSGDNRPGGFVPPGAPSSWLLFSSNYLYCGREIVEPLGGGGGDPQIQQPQTGVWVIPLTQIDPEVARQRKDQHDAQARAEAQVKQAWQRLCEKYDSNHNGVIEPAERGNALDDPDFIKFELDTIDTNHNDLLDSEELAWFDANTNRVLEPKEQAGLEIAQHLLAERLLRKFDTNEDGILDRSEFNNLWPSIASSQTHSLPVYTPSFPDANHDGQVDLKELETFLQDQALQRLQRRRFPGGPPFVRPVPADAATDRQRLFKRAVDAYWQHPAGTNNGPLFRNRVSPGTGGV